MTNNERINIEVFDQAYGPEQVGRIVEKVRNSDGFLDHAIEIHTSWRGMYFDSLHHQLHGKRILELGAGNGLNALILGRLGAEVLAIDISPASESLINAAAEELKMTNVRALSGDFPSLGIDSSAFDCVLGKNFLHHLTHEQETVYLEKVVAVLKRTGFARFFEPAVNSPLLDALRWFIPVPGRPSKLQGQAFRKWKAMDPHPDRDNSSDHFRTVGQSLFQDVKIDYLGSLERFGRLIPNSPQRDGYRRWAHRFEKRIPRGLRKAIARSQTITYANPK